MEKKKDLSNISVIVRRLDNNQLVGLSKEGFEEFKKRFTKVLKDGETIDDYIKVIQC